MIDTTDNGFRAAIQALRDIVSPAVDPAHPLAREQVSLVIDWLEFQRTRTPLLRARNRALLGFALATARKVEGEEGDPDLAAATTRAAVLFADPDAADAAIAAASAELNERMSALIREAANSPAARRDRLEALIVRDAEAALTLQRAWFAPFGLEADPGSVPDLNCLLVAPTPAAAEERLS